MIDFNITTCCALSLRNYISPCHLRLVPAHGNKLLTRTEIESLLVAAFFVSSAAQEINWNHDLFLAQYFLIMHALKMFIAAKT